MHESGGIACDCLHLILMTYRGIKSELWNWICQSSQEKFGWGVSELYSCFSAPPLFLFLKRQRRKGKFRQKAFSSLQHAFFTFAPRADPTVSTIPPSVSTAPCRKGGKFATLLYLSYSIDNRHVHIVCPKQTNKQTPSSSRLAFRFRKTAKFLARGHAWPQPARTSYLFAKMDTHHPPTLSGHFNLRNVSL